MGIDDSFEITLLCSMVISERAIPVTIQLTALHQSLVYAGLLEGVPTEEWNLRLINRAVEKAQRAFGHSTPFLIQPKQEPLNIDREYPFGKPATIPDVQCIAYFRCLLATQGQGADYSSMTMVWFQKQYAMPIDPEVLDQIQAVDWLELATNAEW